MKQIFNKLRKIIRKDYGEKCEDFARGCVVCDVYHRLEMLEEFLIKNTQMTNFRKINGN